MPRELMHDEIEWVNPPDAIETGTRRGLEQFEEAESALGRAYSSVEIEVERLVEGGDSVAAITDVLFHGRGSGIEVRQRMGFLFALREGKITRFEWSNDPDRLLVWISSEENG
ncbi:MAG: nuclear transport factor 2 family protein [Solirubrobacterales bacterium]